jgi:hypothetical protein
MAGLVPGTSALLAGMTERRPDLIETRSKDIAKNNCFKMSVIARLDRAIQ